MSVIVQPISVPNWKLSRPSLAVLQSLQARLLLRTDVHGWIDVATDGENLWVRSER